mgnify:CR=1 FL=1
MKNKLAKIYITEMKKNKYMVYMAVDDYLYGLGTYKYCKRDETWEVEDEILLTEGMAQRRMYRAMVIGMARIGETIAELASGTLQEPLIWDVRGERTVCAAEIICDVTEACVCVQASYACVNWCTNINKDTLQDAHRAAKDMCLGGVPHWAAYFAITTMKRWKKIMKQRKQEA